jgi:hypothetical protein
VAISQLAEELDRQTLELALRIVPVQWWAARLGDAHLERPSQGTARLSTAREF